MGEARHLKCKASWESRSHFEADPYIKPIVCSLYHNIIFVIIKPKGAMILTFLKIIKPKWVKGVVCIDKKCQH